MAVARTLAFLCMIGISLTLPPRTTAGDQPQPSTTDRVIRDTKEAVEATKQYTLQQKETFQKAVQAELAEMQVKIAELQKKTHAASAEARTEMQKALQDLERRRRRPEEKLYGDRFKTSLIPPMAHAPERIPIPSVHRGVKYAMLGRTDRTNRRPTLCP